MKKKPQHLILLALLFIASQYVLAEESGFGSARHAVGFSGGGVIGTGLTYRIYSSRSFFQGTFLGRATSRDKISLVLMGASYGHILSEISVVKALPPTALVFIGGIDGQYSDVQNLDDTADEESGKEKSFRTGAGIALEIGNTFSPGLLFSLGTTYALAMEQLNGNWEWNLEPQVNFGLLYNW